MQFALWKTKLRLNPRLNPIPLPIILAGGSVTTLYPSPETCVDTSDLINKLARPVLDFTAKVDCELRFLLEDRRVTTVIARTATASFEFLPKAVVISSGASNISILSLLCEITTAPKPRQRLREWHMLVVSGPEEKLPTLTGCFNRSLFVASRQNENEVVWLLSDGKERRTDVDAACSLYNKWRNLVPRCEDWRADLKWSIYRAPASELLSEDRLPAEPQFETVGLENVTAVWPTKLSLAPDAVNSLCERIAPLTPYPLRWNSPPETWLISRTPPEIAHERWQSVSLMNWSEFSKAYLLDC